MHAHTHKHTHTHTHTLIHMHAHTHTHTHTHTPTWVGTRLEKEGLVFVLQVVLDVAHLVVNSDQIVHHNIRAHLDSETTDDFL